MPAGFTFLGQFLDHDMTFDPTSSLARQQDPEAIRNFRVPSLDLDSVYGGGPGASPHLYDTRIDGGQTVERVERELLAAMPELSEERHAVLWLYARSLVQEERGYGPRGGGLVHEARRPARRRGAGE